jgi:hypothetical protein
MNKVINSVRYQLWILNKILSILYNFFIFAVFLILVILPFYAPEYLGQIIGLIIKGIKSIH